MIRIWSSVAEPSSAFAVMSNLFEFCHDGPPTI